jgi:hypothetical protein
LPSCFSTFDEINAVRRSLSLLTLVSAATAAAASPVSAADLTLTLDLPRQTVAEYHRPYVAIWLERADQTAAGTLSVWYETEREEHGRKYLKELRQWWRKAGREMTFPVDGVSGATRAPGPQKIAFKSSAGPLASLPPGEYVLVVEVAREVGGRESVRLPLSWPAKRGQTASATGSSELGAVRLSAR